jgi:endonuclease/exonuclease/phosphatase (EEP) superfamily protein YafD
MKLKYMVVVMLIAVIGLHAANNKRLFGVWELVEFQLVQKGKPVVSDEKTLRDAGAVWNLYFNEDGSFKQEFNMRSPDMKMETEKGKWSTVNDSLFIELQMDTTMSRMNYSYILLGDVVVLTLQHPTSPDKVVTRFRRK